MEIRHNPKKEELRHDPVLDAIASTRAYLNKNRTIALGAVAAILAVVVVVQVVVFVNKQTQAKAAELFGKAVLTYAQDPKGARTAEALTEVETRYRGTVHGVYSAFLLGNIAFEKGNYEEASARFSVASHGNSNAGFVKGEAVEGLGKCAEASGDFEKAASYYEKVLADKQMTYRRPALMWRLALINTKLTRKDKALELCNTIIGDTLAFEYRRKAQNLSAEISAR